MNIFDRTHNKSIVNCYDSWMSSVKTLIDLRKINSFQDVSSQLRKLEKVLDQEGLPQFQLFNSAYLVVTNKIISEAASHHFDYPEFIEKFTVNFSSYYFRAINETAMNSDSLPPAWRMMNKAF